MKAVIDAQANTQRALALLREMKTDDLSDANKERLANARGSLQAAELSMSRLRRSHANDIRNVPQDKDWR